MTHHDATDPRNFTIQDGMILVAAAGGFALRRAVGDALATYTFNAYSNDFSQFGSLLYGIIEAGFPFLLALTPAVLVMRLRRHRPRWRRLIRQPGMAASCAALIPIATGPIGLRQFTWFLEHPDPPMTGGIDGDRIAFGDFISVLPLGEIYGSYGSVAGLWVLGAWLVLWPSGRRRPEQSWIDRPGRLFGIGWLSILAISSLAFLMS
jgi:hypothetical protein